ncbi:MAG: PP2C family protein-serine/threonine phosphatase [Terriglobales bacterium]
MATSRSQQGMQAEPLAIALNTVAPRETKRVRKVSAEALEVQVTALEQDRRQVYQELFEAAQVQRRLSGARHVERAGFEIASEVFPVRHLAGDFVTTIEIGEQVWIALGDIEGKGLAAAMWFTHLVSLIRCHALADPNVASVMTRVNRDLCGLQPSPPLTAMVLLAIDSSARPIEYCNAGHPSPLAVRRDGQVERLEVGGPLLGVLSGATYESERVELRAGDLLLGCSDGVLECHNEKDEDFGYTRVITQAQKHADDTARAILFSILGAVQDFAGDTPRQDDVSVLVIRPAKDRRQ